MATVAYNIPRDAAPKAFGRKTPVVLSIFLFAVLAIRGAWIGDANADIDEQLYSLIGNAMTQGALPYVDLWDRKPFGLFALYALAHWIGGPGPASYQLLAAAFTLGGAWLVYVMATRLVDWITACGAGLFYIALMSLYGAHSGNSEVFFVPLMLGMAALVLDHGHEHAVRRACFAMLLGGLALQVKYTVLPQCLFFGLWALWGRYRAGTPLTGLAMLAAAFAALGLLPTAVVASGYALAGYWDDFLFANVLSFFERLPSDAGRLHRDLAVFLLPLVLLAAGGLYAAFRITPPSEKRTYLFCVLWLCAALATVFLPATVYRYYFAAAVPATVLVAVPLLDRRGPARLVPACLLFVGLLFIQNAPAAYEGSREQRAALDRLAGAIAPLVDPETQCLWIFDGPTSLYRLSGSCLPTRFIYPDHLNNVLEKVSLGIVQEEEVARILTRQPPVIVTASEEFTPQNEEARALVMATVERDYTAIAQETLHGRDITAWARKPVAE